ncbi:MAG: YaaR family protein [Firmicutes bacterium]|nr:YaaR family protein [Bacillota bacterium]
MRVSKAGARRQGSVVRSSRRSRSSPTQPVFGEVLRAEQEQAIDLSAALAEIDDYARQFMQSPVLANLLRYKKKVRELLHYLVRQSYEVQESSFYDPQGRRRLFVMVEIINQKLEELGREFLSKHGPPLDLVRRLDEIRGLLLDLEI